MVFNFRHFIFLIYKYDNGVKSGEFIRFNPRLGQDYYVISGLKMSRRRTVEANITAAAFALHDIGLPEYAV